MADFGGFQEQGYDLTEKEIKALEREIIQIYRNAQLSLEADLEKVYSKLAGISPENAGYYNELLKRERLRAILADVSKTYGSFINQANTKIVAASKLAVTNNYYRQLYASSWGATVMFGAIPEQVVNLSVFGSAEAWKDYTKSIAAKFGDGGFYQPKEGTLSDILLNNKRLEQERIRQAITQGLIEGKSINKMANDIKDITGREIVKDGKKTLTGAKANATRIVRTETNRTMNAGAFAQSIFLQSQDIDTKKRWLATLDTRTRERHSALDGKTIEVDEAFKIGTDSALYPGDFGQVGNNVNCRCTTIDVIPDFEPDTRIGRNPVTGKNEVFSYRNFDQWAKDNGLQRSKSGRLVHK